MKTNRAAHTQQDMAIRAKGRPPNYEQLSARQQWAIDKALGILDWDGVGYVKEEEDR